MNRDHIFLMLMGNRSVRFGLSLFDLAVLAAAVAAGFWLLVVGCWLLAVGCCL